MLEAGLKKAQRPDQLANLGTQTQGSEPAVSESGDHKIGHAFNAGSGTGGSAIHHYGVWLRMHEGDFSLKSDHGWASIGLSPTLIWHPTTIACKPRWD